MIVSRWDHGGDLYLRPFEVADITERYLRWFSDSEFTRFLDARNLSYEDVVQHRQKGIDSGSYRMFAVCLSGNDMHIGNIKIGPIHWRHMTSDLVTTLGDRTAWGKGYARSAIRIAIEIAFREMNIRKLSASIDSLNIGSVKAYTAAGFEVEAKLPNQFMNHSDEGSIYSDKIYVACYNPDFDIDAVTGFTP